MNQEERLNDLLKKLKEDSVQYKELQVEDTVPEKRRAVRSLMNIRMPRRIPEDILQVQDAFLQEECRIRGVVSLEDIPDVRTQYKSSHPFAEKISVWQGDITRLKVGAIVNAANSQMLGCFVPCHKCIDNAIHSAAGLQLRQECSHIMDQKRIPYGKQYEEPTGQAVLTRGYNLPARYVIHTVGPIVYNGLNQKLRQDLHSCYNSVLECCVQHDIRTVAFCCISTGEFHFPNDEAAKIAVETVTEFLHDYESKFDRIIFNVFQDLDRELYEQAIM